MSYEDRLVNRPVRTLLWTGLAAIGIVSVLGAASWAINLASQPGKVLTRTFDADNMIHNYEWFRQQFFDVNKATTQLGVAQAALNTFLESAGDRSTWSFEDKQEFSRLNANVAGAQGYRATLINDYNAASSMANKAIFRGDFPETIQ